MPIGKRKVAKVVKPAPIECFMVVPTGEYSKWVNIPDGGRRREVILMREDTGEKFQGYKNLPVGAMWFAPWLDETFIPQLEHVLIVKTPGGDWIPDSEAANCTKPADRYPKQQDHHCWIIKGKLPKITVSKRGKTCKAGAGSIGQKDWHGFLIDGFLVQ